jgi:hypothetical protein
MEENNQEILDELNEVLGEENKDTDIEQLILHLSKIKDRMNINEKFVDGVNKLLDENKEMKNVLNDLIEVMVNKDIKLPESYDVNVSNPVDQVTVKNLSEIKIPEPKSEVKINNLTEIPNYKSDVKALAELQAQVVRILLDKEIKSDLDRYMDVKRPLAVRLSDGRKFYDAIGQAVSSAIGVGVTDADGHQQVDVLSMPSISVDTTGLATEAKQLPDGHNVTVDNASGASAVNIQDGGNTITVDGSLTVDLGANNDVTITSGTITTITNAVTVDLGSNNDVTVTSGYTPKSAVINCSTSGDNTIVSAVADKVIRVVSILIVSDGTVDARFESGASGTALTGQIPLQAREGYAIANPFGLFSTGSNTLLNLELSDTINVHGFVTYYEV